MKMSDNEDEPPHKTVKISGQGLKVQHDVLTCHSEARKKQEAKQKSTW